MTTDADSRIIGRLEAQFEAMQKQIEALAAAQKEALEESREGRRRIYEAQDENRKEITGLSVAVKSIKETMAVDKPILDGISRWKERIIGMQMLITGISVAITGGTILFWKWIALKIGLN